jgi:hypothetical protein
MRTNHQPAVGRSKVTWSWQLKVELLEVSPAVWRRLTVPETIKLPKLHQILQVAFDWTNSHLHQFVIAGVAYSNADPDDAAELDHRDEGGVTLEKALGIDARCFDYVYDFGDDWHHGYAELLAALADPGHEDHQRYLEWSGGSFDPRRFDIDAVNLALSKIKP